MPRSRSSSRPASRPSSRPPSMMSTALNLSPQVQHLGDLLIAKITGFSRDEENFGICHDFLVSNLLYHTYLEPHDRDVTKRCEKLSEKWDIQNKGQKSARFEELLSRYHESPIFSQGVDHEQHGLKGRLLVLLLSLTNSDQVQVDVDENAIDEGVEMLLNELVQESESSKAARKAAEIRALLAEGEDLAPQYSDYSDLSDWSSDEELEDIKMPTIVQPEKKVSIKHVRRPITHLPGVSQPLQPPKSIDEFEDCQALMSEAQAKEWLEDNLIPPYWTTEIDSKFSYALEVTNPMPDSHYVQDIDTYLYEDGQPVEEKLILPEYQVLYECIWMMRNPLCQKSPLFLWTGQEFMISPLVGLPSLMPLTLASSLEKFRISLNLSHSLHSFISDTLDRRKDSGDIEDLQKPPFTYEAYAEALTNVMNLFSADLLETERKIKGRTETYTMLDFFQEVSTWQKLINSLGTFHFSAITKHEGKENWEKAVLLLSALDQAVSTCHEEKLFSILVDLHLKTMAPYFRIIGVWLTQGRFEDYRSEFVYGVHDSIVSGKVNSELDLTGCSSSFVSYLSTPSEKFWTHGFIVKPFQELAQAEGLRSPQIFEKAFPKILTCGKSITILSFLEKQSVLYPGYKSTFTPIQDMINPHELYDNFLANLRQRLSIHRVSKLLPKLKKNLPAIPMIAEGLSLCDVIGNVDQYDPDLVAAYDIISADLPSMDEEEFKFADDIEEGDNLIDPDRFLVLSGFGLDPVRPMTSTIKEAFVPVVHIHTDRACQRLVHLFRHTLDLEQSLVYLRRIFFMEAGDLMSEFYNHMFEMVGYRKEYEQWDATSLNILLHDCLSRRLLTEEIEKFSIDIDLKAKNPLETLVLSYNVKWPLNIVLHSQSIEMYNKIFNFLLKVKHSLWALLKIDCKELATTMNSEETESFDSFSIDSSSRMEESTEDKENKLHRVILLRSWLLHFISNVHDYFMTRVLQSTQMELHASLMECDDLDAILDVHNRYIHRIYDRCFLHSSASLLKECVFKVLKSAMVLYKHCETHIQSPRRDVFIIDNSSLKSLEENYARRHQFLATTLRSMTQKRNIPHLDGLSAALLHSCPEVQ